MMLETFGNRLGERFFGGNVFAQMIGVTSLPLGADHGIDGGGGTRITSPLRNGANHCSS